MAERVLTTPEASLAYNTKLDVQAYQVLLDLRWHLEATEFEEELNSLNQLTRFNVETSIGERFNVELFQTVYHIEENLIIHPLYKKPFIEIMKRGQKFRQEKGSTDIEREVAEVEGFEKMSRILLDIQGESLSGRKIIIISPQGGKNSSYQHNFFDVWQRQGDKILLSRFTCKFPYQEFYQAAVNVNPFANLPENPTDADFLSTPLVTYKKIEEIQKIFSPDEQTMSVTSYQRLLESCSYLTDYYLDSLLKNPNEIEAENIYRALCKKTDILTGQDPHNPYSYLNQPLIETINRPKTLAMELTWLTSQPVRQASGGCGLFAGSSTTSSVHTDLLRPFSVVEFGLGNNSCENCSGPENHFHCPSCGGTIPSGQGITTCPHCGLTKEQAGSRC